MEVAMSDNQIKSLELENTALRAHILGVHHALGKLLDVISALEEVMKMDTKTMESHIENAKLEYKRSDPTGVIDPILVQVSLDEGLVREVASNYPIEAVVFDFDTEGADESDLKYVPLVDGGTKEAFIGGPEVTFDKAYMARVRKVMDSAS